MSHRHKKAFPGAHAFNNLTITFYERSSQIIMNPRKDNCIIDEYSLAQ